MALEFDRLGEVEALSEVPEGANVLGEVDGEIVRLPGSGLGGGGIKTAIIKSSDYDNALAGLMTAVSQGTPITYSCTNMTFEEAYETVASGEPLDVVLLAVTDTMVPVCRHTGCAFCGTEAYGVPLLGLENVLTTKGDDLLFWTADGISNDPPVSE